MGNLCLTKCTDCFYKKNEIMKESLLNIDTINKDFCGYPFCNTNIKNIDNQTILIEFRNIMYCSENCLKLHKKTKYLGMGWAS